MDTTINKTATITTSDVPRVRLYGPRRKAPPGVRVNTTSRSKEEWSRELSPFFLGPVSLYDGLTSNTVEAGWQFSKVYSCHVDGDENPTDKWLAWAQEGWSQEVGERSPMGKGVKPLYVLWDGQKMDYLTARTKVYIPLYANAVVKTDAFAKLKAIYDQGENLALFDFDGFDYVDKGLTYTDIINDGTRSMGHAVVIAALLEGWPLQG